MLIHGGHLFGVYGGITVGFAKGVSVKRAKRNIESVQAKPGMPGTATSHTATFQSRTAKVSVATRRLTNPSTRRRASERASELRMDTRDGGHGHNPTWDRPSSGHASPLGTVKGHGRPPPRSGRLNQETFSAQLGRGVLGDATIKSFAGCEPPRFLLGHRLCLPLRPSMFTWCSSLLFLGNPKPSRSSGAPPFATPNSSGRRTRHPRRTPRSRS